MLNWVVFVLGLWTADPAEYKVVPAESRMMVHVGTAGVFKLFGHDHNIQAKGLSGSVEWDAAAPEKSRFVLEIDSSSFVLTDKDLSEDDRKQIQSDMEAKALDLPKNPKIVFQSSAVHAEKSEGSARRLKISGTLNLRGVSKPVEIPVTLEVSENRLTAKGEMELNGTIWGVPQISAGGGSVKTKEELKLTYEIVAAR